MQTIFQTCVPRDEVLFGELKKDIFAAKLRDVQNGTADPVYQDAQTFFENTYPTAGLRTLLTEALGRLTGVKPANSSIIRLETAFGGGKTHNLIALYHCARGAITADIVDGIVASELLPQIPIQVAGVVGQDLDPVNGVQHADVTTWTLWGEIAHQLGGVDGYRIMQKSDQQRIAPGTGILERLIGDRPTLIMIDEFARHLRVARRVTDGGTSLAEQTVAFLMALLEFAASKKQVVVILTLADVTDAFSQETEQVQQELAEVKRISARQERIITPTGETEIAAIVTHRLFKGVDAEASNEVASVYTNHFKRLIDQAVDIAQRGIRAEYAGEIAMDYPFHPELLTTLNRKTATIPNFHRTRGALRLLAMTVRRLWETKPPHTYLIHPYHLDLGLDDVANDLTSRLERPLYRSVIEADIVSLRKGSPAHAQTIDSMWIEAGKPPYARRAATTIFLHSITQGVASGVDPADLYLAAVHPDDDPAMIDRAITELMDKCWFLDWDGHRYRFKTEPSLNKIIADEMTLVGVTKAKGELDERIKSIWKKGAFQPVYFPSEAAEVDDDADAPKLVIAHYDAATYSATDDELPTLVRKLFDYAGTQEGYRRYKNNLLFLVADPDGVGRMVETAQRHLAIARITSDTDRMREFNDEQRKKLKGMGQESELDVRIAITRAYRYLFYPSADAPNNIARETLPAQEQGELEKNQTDVVLRTLRELDKVITASDNPIAAAFVKAKAWTPNQTSMTTEALRRAFAQRLSLRMLLDPNQLKNTIRDGAKAGVWIYYDPAREEGYGPPSPTPLVQINDDVMLYTPDEAKCLRIKIRGEAQELKPEICPVCGKSPCVCDEDIDEIIGGGGQRQVSLHAEGTPAQAFQAIVDQCADAGVTQIKQWRVRIEGIGKDAAQNARALGVAVPQLGGGQHTIEQQMNAEFGDENFTLTFSGTWNRYKRVKTLTDAFGQEASKVSVKMALRTAYPDGLDVAGDAFGVISEIFTTLGLGKIVVDAQPHQADET